ncbi:MAG: GTP 3',8-cyclase MoaA [Candidatus Omnitrophota bacterium]
MKVLDTGGRGADYLRISVTDRCNLRCFYCMPSEGVENQPHNELLTFEEITRLARIFVSLGITKIRLTGGEPLVRKNILKLVRSLAGIEGVEEISLTTNGALLSSFARDLKCAGLSRINVSLDSLNEDTFKKVTRNRSSLANVLEGIRSAKEAGFDPIKLNVVVIKGVNDNEILDFVEFAGSEKLVLRFIEFMNITPLWSESRALPVEAVRAICEEKFLLKKIEPPHRGSGPAEYFSIDGGGVVGFINTKEDNCRKCSRLRLTSTGRMKVCLYENKGLDLKKLLRIRLADDEISSIIASKMCVKKNTDFTKFEPARHYMCDIGG